MTRPAFDYHLNFKAIDFRQQPALYQIGKGEQGVLLVEPYKSEILPYWKFKTVADAKKSSARIYKLFLAYLRTATLWVRTWPANSSRWAGLVRGATPITRAGASTTARRATSCRESRTRR